MNKISAKMLPYRHKVAFYLVEYQPLILIELFRKGIITLIVEFHKFHKVGGYMLS